MKSHKKNIVRLTESRLKSLINETVAQLLTEDQAGKSIEAAIKLAERYGFDHETAKDFVRNTIRKKFPILNHNNRVNKFILGLTRMYLDENLENDDAKRANICDVMKYVASDAHINEYDRNLNGMSAQELIDRFARNVEMDLERDRNEVNSMQFEERSDYDIVRIDDFEQASEYGEYTDWCVTEDEYAFDSHTSNGINQFYFCLRNGFESVPKEEGENCPLDEYGLSMIAVLVNENGSLVHCTCRWNHEKGGNDNIMTTKEISQVVGMNFYEVFKPNNNWKNAINDAMQRIEDGEDPEDVFDWCGNFYEGYARIELNGKYNLMDREGNLFSPNQWFENCSNFKNGYAWVQLNRKYNYINTKGVPLYNAPINQWFDWCCDFHDGYARVQLKGKWNWIDTEGKLFRGDFNSLDQWFGDCGDFHKGYALVNFNGKYNWVNTKGNLYNYETHEPLGINVKTTSTNESIRNRLTNMIVEKVIRRIQIK